MSSRVILEEKLIECVRIHEILYNTDMKDYSDIDCKLRIWHQIAEHCGLASADEAKKQWKNLRDCYRWALKMRAGKKTKTWKYFEQMSFLRPYMKDRQRNINLSAINTEYTPTFDENSQGSIKEEVPEYVEAGASWTDEETKQFVQGDASPPSKKQCLAGSSYDQLEERATEKQWAQQEMYQVPGDSLKLFFDSMYASTKKLPPALQRAVKHALFQAVTDAEVAAETNQQ